MDGLGCDFTTVKKPNNRDRHNVQFGEKQNNNGTVMSQVSKVLDQKLAPLSRKFLELIPEESLTNVRPLIKNLFTGKNLNLQLAGRLAHFRTGKNSPKIRKFYL